MALSCTAFPGMMLKIYVRSFCRSRVINPYAGRNVGLGHKADMALTPVNVRFRGQSGHLFLGSGGRRLGRAQRSRQRLGAMIEP